MLIFFLFFSRREGELNGQNKTVKKSINRCCYKDLISMSYQWSSNYVVHFSFLVVVDPRRELKGQTMKEKLRYCHSYKDRSNMRTQWCLNYKILLSTSFLHSTRLRKDKNTKQWRNSLLIEAPTKMDVSRWRSCFRYFQSFVTLARFRWQSLGLEAVTLGSGVWLKSKTN